ncbi:MAG: HAMP domain-containing histidine kinase [Desulfarculus sp.]|nr:HAMP domain-containing histidine kinase [Desulfarculus sp.]
MRPLGLYPKILLSFLVLLLMVQALMFGSFLLLDDHPPPGHLDSHLRGLALFSQKFAQQALGESGTSQEPTPETLGALTRELAQITQGQAWVQAAGATLAQSFSGPPPEIGLAPPLDQARSWEGISVVPLPPRQMLIAMPLAAPAPPEARLLLLLAHPPGQPPPHRLFLVRLALVCLLVALLVIPVSRLIARPIRQLRRSALMIADGDLNHRAQVATHDEIGELARALNHMTDRLQQMVLASRELLAYVSHELRSPLARLAVAGQLLGDGLATAPRQGSLRHLEDIREEIARMDDLLARILLLSRLDLHEAPLQREKLDLAELLGRLAERWRPWLAHRGLELNLDMAAPAWVLGDRQALASALSNLLDNVAKHSLPNGRVTLSLARAGLVWRLTLRNPCPPLRSAELEAIFQPFHRGRGGGQGSGLGLALSRRIIAAHGGVLEAQYLPPCLVMEATLPAL